MKKLILIFLVAFLQHQTCVARHIKGGWVQYEYVSSSSGSSTYKVTVYVFRDCVQSGPLPNVLRFYDASTYEQKLQVTGTGYALSSTATKTKVDPCLSNPTLPCYQIYTYSTTVTLPDNAHGYMIVAQDANRVTGIVNIANSITTGISFIGNIPGVLNNKDYHVNSSPFFNFTDTVIICYNSKFTYQFKASDADSDVLTYSFGNGINGTQSPSVPPYSSLTYVNPYSGAAPLGAAVTIDSTTGLISGTAPGTTGEYVIAVYVHEWRNGVMINSTKKELQITVGNCSLSTASLKNVYVNCNSYQQTFQNESMASNITSYAWDFGVVNSTKDTSSSATPTFTYADTGTYTVKLAVSNTGGCRDSATAQVKIYPGFSPSFTVAGRCFQSPIQFNDISFVKYGTIKSRSWDFGDSTTLADTSSLANPSYKYGFSGNMNVVMNITSSVGCSGSFSKTVVINDKPYINLPFTDTLICSIDTLPMKVSSSATSSFKWSPAYHISNTNIANPLVYPKDTTVYTVVVSDQGCVDSAAVKVNVLQFITVTIGPDTGICKTDSFMLKPVSDALSYRWRESTNANSLSGNIVKYPKASPSVTTTYYVTANLGYCQDSARIVVHVSPYPSVNAGNDTAICFGKRIQLSGIVTGSFFSWSPVNTLINTNTLQPVAGPTRTTSYILTAGDTQYCKKLVSDTIIVKVIPPFNVSAGKDTSVTVGQALQLVATGADTAYSYSWSPAAYLDNAFVYNPIATITTKTDPITYTVKATTAEGCSATADIKVTVYENGPRILLPGGFTPNADGRNDILKPILIGISRFDYFNVYNRWGQLLFTTSDRSKGWDGSFKNMAQGSGTYVCTVQGVDVNGNVVYLKGTVVLVR